VLSGRGLCDELITRPEESYRLWRVLVRDLATSLMRRPWPALGCSANRKKIIKVAVGRRRVYGGRLVFLYRNGEKFRIFIKSRY